jgi:hypothetical protein
MTTCIITNKVTGKIVATWTPRPPLFLDLDLLTGAIESDVDPEEFQHVLFGRVTAHKCRRGAWCDWTVLGRTAVCTIGGEIASVGTDGEIAKLEVLS